MPPYSLHLGDCLSALASVEDHSVDLILTDLPYGTTNCAYDEVIPFAPMWDLFSRVLAPRGCVVLFGSQPFTSKLVMSNLAWYRDHLVWDKNKCGSPALAKIRPMRVHEDIIVFSPMRRVRYNPQMEPGKPYARRSKNPEGYVGKHNRHGYGMKPRTEFVNTGTRYPKSVLRISRDFSAQQQVHQHQKPLKLMRWLVLTYSNPGDVILDASMGSGTTGVAALGLGRKFIGCELEPGAFAVAQARILSSIHQVVHEPAVTHELVV